MGPAPQRGRIAPCELRLNAHREKLAEIAAIDKNAYFPALGRLALTDYWLFLRDVLLYSWLDPWFHGEEVVPFLMNTMGETRVILMPRGAGKTGMITVPYIPWKLANDALCRNLTCNAREEKAHQFARTSAQIIVENERFRACYPYLVPSKKWGEGGYWLDPAALGEAIGSVDRVDPSIGAYSIQGNIVGAHINGVLLHDDLINREIAKSPHQLRIVRDFYVESLNCVDIGTDVIVCGTRWHYDDYYGELQKGSLEGTTGRAKVLRVGLTRPNENGVDEYIWPQTKYFDQATKRSRIVGYDPQKVQGWKKNLGPLFSSLYYNEPVQDADRLFDTQLIKTFPKLPFDLGPVAMVGIECESQSSALVSAIVKMARDEQRVMRIEKIHTGRTDKNERILSELQPVISEARFNLRADLWEREGEGLGEELRHYPKGHDDCLDACAYLSRFAIEAPEGTPPRVYIMVDPAFTIENYSDYTAMVVGCLYRGELWVLDCLTFKTDRVDFLARKLFWLYDHYHRRPRKSLSQRMSLGLRGFGRPSVANGFAEEHPFDCDIDIYMQPRKGETLPQ